MSCIDLNNDALKILATHFSYNKKIERRKKMFKTLTDIQRVLKIWEMRNLTIEGEIFIFKTKTISKTVFQSFRTTVPKYVSNKLEKKQKAFLWNNFTPKIKHEILCNEYKAGGLKNVDIRNKVIALQCSWIIRFYDDSFHESYERFYDDHFHDPAILKNHLALLLNIIQVYSLKVVKPNFSHFFIGKLF